MNTLISLEQKDMDYSLIDNKIARIKLITATDLQQAAQKFIDMDKMLTFISKPKGEDKK